MKRNKRKKNMMTIQTWKKETLIIIHMTKIKREFLMFQIKNLRIKNAHIHYKKEYNIKLLISQLIFQKQQKHKIKQISLLLKIWSITHLAKKLKW